MRATDAANDVYASLHVLYALSALAPKPVTHADLISLSSQPYIDGYGTHRAALSSSTTPSAPRALDAPLDPAPPGTLPSAVLPPRKFEAFKLFTSSSPLSIDDISASMSATLPIKPLSVLWNLIDGLKLLRAKKVAIEGEREVLGRLVEAAEEMQGKWTFRFREEHEGWLQEVREELASENDES